MADASKIAQRIETVRDLLENAKGGGRLLTLPTLDDFVAWGHLAARTFADHGADLHDPTTLRRIIGSVAVSHGKRLDEVMRLPLAAFWTLAGEVDAARALAVDQGVVAEQTKETPAVPLTDEDWAILTTLAENHPRLFTQEQLEGQIPNRCVAIRTIQARLPRLCKAGLVERPEGKRSGYWTTDAGLAIVARRK